MAKNGEPVKKQKKKNIDFIFYLQRVISEKVPPLEKRIAENNERATQLTRKILGAAMTYDPIFQHYFLDMESLGAAKAKIQTMDPNNFACRVFFKRCVIPDAFMTICGLQHCFPPGFAMFKINEKRTHEERIAIRSNWGNGGIGCLDKQEYMTPHDIYPWFYAGIVSAVKRLTSGGKHEDLRDLVVIPTFPNVTVELPAEEESENALTIHIIPAIKGTGWPFSARLQNPMPNRRPYLDHGQRYMKRIEDGMEDGQGMWYLEAREISLPRTLERSKLFTSLLADPHQRARLWKLSFEPAESHMMQCLREFKESNADAVLKIFQVLAQKQGGFWEVLDQEYLQAVMQGFYKKRAPHLKNVTDVFNGMLDSLITTVEAMSCPHFLLPTVNVLDKLEKSKASGILEELCLFRDLIQEDPAYVLEYTGCIKPRRRQEPEAEDSAGAESLTEVSSAESET